MEAAKVHLIESLEPRRFLDGTVDDRVSGMCCELECAGLIEVEQSPQIEVHQSDILLSSEDGRISGVLAEFEGVLRADGYSVTIDWGDGRRSDLPVQVQPDGSYAVIGEHEYANADRYDITINVLGSDGSAGYEYHLGWTHMQRMNLPESSLVEEAPEPVMHAARQTWLTDTTATATIAHVLFSNDEYSGAQLPLPGGERAG